MKPRKSPPANKEDADTLALQGLTFIAADPQRLVRFLSLTGLTPQDLKKWGQDPTLAVAVLEYLLADESLLLVFTAEKGIRPETVAPAHALLSGGHGRDWHSA
ncbi:MAG: DUF3572 domain-containing protein [Hyphomicrobium sp.]|jgi:hypothetical protein|nr:DUF3572 domain-containing protein [Hyphomicrobium sp.]